MISNFKFQIYDFKMRLGFGVNPTESPIILRGVLEN